MITEVYNIILSSAAQQWKRHLLSFVQLTAWPVMTGVSRLRYEVCGTHKEPILYCFSTTCPFTPHPHPLFCPLQCTYSTGHCLHLLSKCAGPDPELQWKEGECEGWMGEEGRRLGGEGAPHSTLSTLMRREEASQAEVSVAHPTMKVWCICVTTKEMCITTATVQSYSVQTDSVTAIVHLQSAFPKVFQTQNIAKYSALKNCLFV